MLILVYLDVELTYIDSLLILRSFRRKSPPSGTFLLYLITWWVFLIWRGSLRPIFIRLNTLRFQQQIHVTYYSLISILNWFHLIYAFHIVAAYFIVFYESVWWNNVFSLMNTFYSCFLILGTGFLVQAFEFQNVHIALSVVEEHWLLHLEGIYIVLRLNILGLLELRFFYWVFLWWF